MYSNDLSWSTFRQGRRTSSAAMSSDVCNNIADIQVSGSKKLLPISARPPVPGAPSSSVRPSEESSTADGRVRQTLSSLKMSGTRCTSSAIEERDCEPEGSDSVTPPYTRWAESLHALLSDSDGAGLFRKFVTQENQQNTLLFYFAVEGYKKDRPSHERTELAKIIHRRFVKQNGESRVDISAEVRTEVAEGIRNSAIGPDLFDKAQEEVERVIKKTSYPSFLKSDLYVQYVSNGGISPDSTESTSSSGSQIPHGYLPTLPEDSELDVSPKRGEDHSRQPLHVPLTQEMLLVTQGRRSKVGKQQEGQFLRGSGRPRLSPYHPSYAAFAPAASTNDSELQSLSSDAISDDTMSLTDSSVDGYPTRKTHKKKMNQVIRNNMRQNGKLPTFPEMPAMHRPPRDHVPQSPAEFAKILIEKLKVLENQQMAEDKLNAKLRKVEEEDLDLVKSAAPPLTKETEPLIPGLLEEDPNSILDDHLHRVFDSAKQSPSGHSPRSRSPDRAHMGKLTNPSSLLPPAHASTNNGHVRNISHKGLPRQKSRDSGLHLTDAPLIHHHHQHYKHFYSKGRLPPQEAMQHIHYAKVYPVDAVDSSKHKSKRSSKKSDISSTTKTTDSGIYEGPPSLPSDGEVNPHKRIEDWLHHSAKGAHKKGHRSSADSHSSSQQRKTSGHSTMRSSSSSHERTHITTLNHGGYVSTHKVGHFPTQPFIQDPSMPPMQPPEPRVVLEEARRRIDLSSKQKSSSSKSARGPSSSGASTLTRSVQGSKVAAAAVEEDQTSGKTGKKSSSASSSSERTAEKPVTTVAYFLSPDPIPYRTTLPGKKITLRQFKTLINKRGSYSYTFKMPSEEFESGVVHQIVSDDDAVLPLYEGKIVGKVEKVDCPETHM